MIKWKKRELNYQNLPKECRELMKECNPFKIREKQKRKAKNNFSNLEKKQK